MLQQGLSTALNAWTSAVSTVFAQSVENSNTFLQNVLGDCWEMANFLVCEWPQEIGLTEALFNRVYDAWSKLEPKRILYAYEVRDIINRVPQTE